MEQIPIAMAASAHEAIKLEKELELQRKLAGHLLGRIIDAYDSNQYDQFSYASAVYRETQEEVQNIEVRLWPWLKEEYARGEDAEAALLGTASRQLLPARDTDEITAKATPRRRIRKISPGHRVQQEFDGINPLKATSIFVNPRS